MQSVLDPPRKRSRQSIFESAAYLAEQRMTYSAMAEKSLWGMCCSLAVNKVTWCEHRYWFAMLTITEILSAAPEADENTNVGTPRPREIVYTDPIVPTEQTAQILSKPSAAPLHASRSSPQSINILLGTPPDSDAEDSSVCTSADGDDRYDGAYERNVLCVPHGFTPSSEEVDAFQGRFNRTWEHQRVPWSHDDVYEKVHIEVTGPQKRDNPEVSMYLLWGRGYLLKLRRLNNTLGIIHCCCEPNGASTNHSSICSSGAFQVLLAWNFKQATEPNFFFHIPVRSSPPAPTKTPGMPTQCLPSFRVCLPNLQYPFCCSLINGMRALFFFFLFFWLNPVTNIIPFSLIKSCHKHHPPPPFQIPAICVAVRLPTYPRITRVFRKPGSASAVGRAALTAHDNSCPGRGGSCWKVTRMRGRVFTL